MALGFLSRAWYLDDLIVVMSVQGESDTGSVYDAMDNNLRSTQPNDGASHTVHSFLDLMHTLFSTRSE